MVKKKEIIQKARVYIDGANLFYAQKHLGWFIDWKKIIKLLNKRLDILEIKYYTGIKANDEKMKGYLAYLRKINIKTITKPLKIIKNKDETTIYKSNCDIEIALDMVLDESSYNTAVLLSGDSDFLYLIKTLQKQFQKKIWVISSRKTISWEIKIAADYYQFLEDIKDQIKRT